MVFLLRPALCALLLLAALLIVACTEKDPVVRTIDRVVEAAEDRVVKSGEWKIAKAQWERER